MFCISYACRDEVEDNGFGHGCNVLVDLVKPWANTDRLVVADSYYASVEAAIRLHKDYKLRFIGVVKTATAGFPMNYLSSVVLPKVKGDWRGVVSSEGNTDLLAFVWVDRNRRYFISTCSSLKQTTPIVRNRWKQMDATANAEPDRMHLEIAQPEASDQYYGACQKIDQHNGCRQGQLKIERKIQTKQWHLRVATPLLGNCVVDAYLLAIGCQGNKAYDDQAHFYELLAEQLIDNDYDASPAMSLRPRPPRQHQQPASPEKRVPSGRQLLSPTPTKRRKKSNPKKALQGHCMVCKAHTTSVCRECQNTMSCPQGDNQYWICSKSGKICMGNHIHDKHPNFIRNMENEA